ncbi:hypothetical protein OS242_04495 [Tumebacillus sp. DT12]|uniref:Uncharacterized protein n=1 Tax=Tumebacillus lacus TaxID=2995335 RepID=A0ABT3WWZ8_9BACL|nr:hypothetical protein [Tumebacillus lacus]MCX7569210.1 hypothetical protein [Tumebacillus lacus]
MQAARNSTNARYKGKEYSAHRPYRQTNIELISTDSADLQSGFVEFTKGCYYKEVAPSEIESAYSVTSYALYQGTQFQVTKTTGDRVLLYHSGPSLQAEELGFNMVDRFEYEKEVDRSELEKMWEERTPIWGFQLPTEPDTIE